ncbi:VOC family protein [Mucilaginibacter gossypii]|uniref:VOC family protein n=1 Tax=Mucilaginibacter gossypii TaxID=551996 RepID=UPI000DCEE818|nr:MULTISPECIES: VOC family protein [Mucilaginibacter]QTE39757.1 VOC family protein [Mucilaginibacter gossypii]RAV58366.1 Long-chain-fatty-acid--CoA ligase [Mucilaginibacter rubeus]
MKAILESFDIDYIEIYSAMAKSMAYWHSEALGFTLQALKNAETGHPGISSYMMKSRDIRLVITSTYPSQHAADGEISAFISSNYCGVKRIALKVPSVKLIFEHCMANGAVPTKFPCIQQDEFGKIEEAGIKFYDHSELLFISREQYVGVFKPGYKQVTTSVDEKEEVFTNIDHVASEVRINEMSFWTKYLTDTIGTSLVQRIKKSADNRTGMMLNINQSHDKKLTLVIAEPESYLGKSKVQQNIDAFGPGIHHLAFATEDLIQTAEQLLKKNVEFVTFPPAYYDLLRTNEDFREIDIDILQKLNILCDKEGDTYLMQKFIKPISDRPFFLYEIVQRVNGYSGFALKNINILKKAEEMEIMRTVE